MRFTERFWLTVQGWRLNIAVWRWNVDARIKGWWVKGNSRRAEWVYYAEHYLSLALYWLGNTLARAALDYRRWRGLALPPVPKPSAQQQTAWRDQIVRRNRHVPKLDDTDYDARRGPR